MALKTSKRVEMEYLVMKNKQELEATEEEKVLVSQKSLLKKMKEQEKKEVVLNIGNSVRRALATEDEDGVRLVDELVAKSLANLRHKDKVTVSEINQLQTAIGENKTTVDVNVDAKGMEEVLSKIVTGKGF